MTQGLKEHKEGSMPTYRRFALLRILSAPSLNLISVIIDGKKNLGE